MYSIYDKRSAIKVVQRLLSLNESGVYDEKTMGAVKNFQSINELEQTGVVDYITFTRLRAAKVAAEQESKARARISGPTFPYKAGDRSADMGVINSDLREALLMYTHEDILPRGDYYTSYTASAAKRLREVYMLEEGYHIDEELYYKVICDILT